MSRFNIDIVLIVPNFHAILMWMPQAATNPTLKELELIAVNIRRAIIGMITQAQSGHPAGALGTTDIITALYFCELKPEDDFILSNGHICPVLYAALAAKSIIDSRELATFRQINTRLQGHPHNTELPELATSSGPLGQGLSQAIGMVLANKLDNKHGHVFCMISDGELQEGQTWEALMYAGVNQLAGLTVIVDRNHIQISGNTEDVLSPEPLTAKLEAFNWAVIDINGNNMAVTLKALKEAKADNLPTAIIANTIPGKGVEFMEYQFSWHGKAPSKTEAEQALKELDTLEARVRSKS